MMSALLDPLTPEDSRSLGVARIAGRIGAELGNIRLDGDLSADLRHAIMAALHQHKVIVIRDQRHLTDEEQTRFGLSLGPAYENPGLPEHLATAMYELDGSKPNGRAESWHTDSTFSAEPPLAAVLRGATIPAFGGDTTFANCAVAYETLPADLRSLADQLWVVHSNQFDYAAMRPDASQEEIDYFEKVTTARRLRAEHPLVHVHPVTRERSLMIGKYAQRLCGHTAADSDRIKAIFQDHITKLENTMRWRWRQHDVVIWDNFATQHKVINDWGSQPRVVRRWTLKGFAPVSIDGRTGRQI
jgi:taurine dioxygenase